MNDAGCTPAVTTTVAEYPTPCAGLHLILESEIQAEDSHAVDPTRAESVLSYVLKLVPVMVTSADLRPAPFASATDEVTAASYVNAPVKGPAICLP